MLLLGNMSHFIKMEIYDFRNTRTCFRSDWHWFVIRWRFYLYFCLRLLRKVFYYRANHSRKIHLHHKQYNTILHLRQSNGLLFPPQYEMANWTWRTFFFTFKVWLAFLAFFYDWKIFQIFRRFGIKNPLINIFFKNINSSYLGLFIIYKCSLDINKHINTTFFNEFFFI